MQNDKVLNDIIFILQRLFLHMKERNKLDLLMDNKNVKLISDYLYELYSFDFKYSMHFADIISREIHPDSQYSIDTELNTFINNLRKCEKLLDSEGSGFLKKNLNVEGWILYDTVGTIRFQELIGVRLYINVKTDFMEIAVKKILDMIKAGLSSTPKCTSCRNQSRPMQLLCEYCSSPLPKVYPVKFNFANYKTIDKNKFMEALRPEKITLYIYDWKSLPQLIANWFRPIQGILNPQIPLFTQKLIPGIGYAPNPTAEQQERANKHTKIEDIQSFGGILCNIIAKVICATSIRKGSPITENEIPEIADLIFNTVLKENYKFEFSLGMKE